MTCSRLAICALVLHQQTDLQCYVLCVVNLLIWSACFDASNSLALATSGMALTGLRNFLKFSSLHYVCSLCSKINSGKGNVSTQELAVKKQSIDELDRKMASILKVVLISADVAPGAS